MRGRAAWEDGGSVNHAEADAFAGALADMIRVNGFTGSIGVLSPFNSQVALLTRRIRAALTEAEQARVELRVSTIDKFQGGELDVERIAGHLVPVLRSHRQAAKFGADYKYLLLVDLR